MNVLLSGGDFGGQTVAWPVDGQGNPQATYVATDSTGTWTYAIESGNQTAVLVGSPTSPVPLHMKVALGLT